MKLKLRKLIAGTLAATMVIGSGMTAFAAETDISSNPATGSDQVGKGTAYDHVITESIKVELPTAPTQGYNYFVDPEQLVAQAGALAQGTSSEAGTVITGVKGNADGVYFLQKAAEGSTPAVYGSTSAPAKIKGINSVPIVISATAKAAVGTTDKDIKMADTQADFDEQAAKAFGNATPMLLMKVKVGSKEGIIPDPDTSTDGVTVNYLLPGQPKNFKMTAGTDGQYTYAAKTDAGITWSTVDVLLAGKTNYAEVKTSGHTAPKITLTWKAEKVKAPTVTSSATTISVQTADTTTGVIPNATQTFSDMGNATDVASVALKANATAAPVELARNTKTIADISTTNITGWEFVSNSTAKTIYIQGSKVKAGTVVVITFDNGSTVELTGTSG